MPRSAAWRGLQPGRRVPDAALEQERAADFDEHPLGGNGPG